ncbi:MAG: gamma carbonic anhydrase family protein [Clostridia bacterium]|nr:gamma carbonic anhydrase family protein [Clostridia bacterium]
MIYAFDGHSPVIEEGAYVSETAIVIGDVFIGRDCYIGHGAVIRGDYGRVEIGEGTAVEEGVIIHAPPGRACKIGKRVTFGHGAIIHSRVIEDFVLVGMGAITSLGTEIGEFAIIAEGSVVKMMDKIPPRVMAAGSPARVIRPVSDREFEFWKEDKQNYVDLAHKYLKQGMQRIG